MNEPFFYERAGESFVPTELTRGPWSNDHQHGGPPIALLGHWLESFGTDAAEFVLVRATVELMRPVPLEPLDVDVTYTAQGKLAQRLTGVLTSGGKELLRATGLRLRRRHVSLPEGVSTPAPEVPPPDSVDSFRIPFFRHERGYHRAVDLRFVRGEFGDRQVTVWARPTASLLAGEPLTPLQRVLLLADAESGMCPPLPISEFTFVNPDLTVVLERPLEGEWLGLDIRAAAHPIGTGIAESALFDQRGTFGRSAQSLTVLAREAP